MSELEAICSTAQRAPALHQIAQDQSAPRMRDHVKRRFTIGQAAQQIPGIFLGRLADAEMIERVYLIAVERLHPRKELLVRKSPECRCCVRKCTVKEQQGAPRCTGLARSPRLQCTRPQ